MAADLLEAFIEVKATTACPFAANAKLVVGPTCTAKSQVVHVGELVASLEEYLKRFRADRLDGYAWAVEGEETQTLTSTADLFARTLAALADADPAPPNVPWRLIETGSWQYSFAGERLFLNLFSPCYPADHSKHLAARDGFVVFAQPEDAFDFCGIDQRRQAVKADIRRRFVDIGKGYDGSMIDRRIEAELYVFPMAVGDPPVRWWNHPTIAALRGR